MIRKENNDRNFLFGDIDMYDIWDPTVKGIFTTTWMTWFADLRISLYMKIWWWIFGCLFFRETFGFVYRLKTRKMMTSEEVHGLKPPTFVQMLLNCDCFLLSFSDSEITAFWRARSTTNSPTKHPREMIFFWHQVIGATEWKFKQQECCPTRFLFVGRFDSWMSLFKHVPSKILTLDSWNRCFHDTLILYSTCHLFLSKFYWNQEAGTNLLDFAHLLQRNHSLVPPLFHPIRDRHP